MRQRVIRLSDGRFGLLLELSAAVEPDQYRAHMPNAPSHGLRAGALGLAAGIAIGVASTAPAYSLASTLSSVSKALGESPQLAPAVIVAAFLPMFLIGIAFARLNRLQPDCGTSFVWVTRSMGPWLGWMTGWATVITGMLVMASLGQIAGSYTLDLLGFENVAENQVAVTAVGIAWIALMTWISVRGIQLSARAQCVMLGLELLLLLAFSAVALFQASGADPFPDAAAPELSWFEIHEVKDLSALSTALIAATFIYWGWESAVSVNEETRDARHVPGRAALISLLALLGTYLLVAVAAQAVHGPRFLAGYREDDVLWRLAKDVFGTWDELVAIAVLLSVIAAAQTTLVPTARTMLAMASAGALTPAIGKVHASFRTPHVATVTLSMTSCVWFIAVSYMSEEVLDDTVSAIGLLVSATYALTGFACPRLWSREGLISWRNALPAVVLPVAGGVALLLILAASAYRFFEEHHAPLWIALASLVPGAAIMVWRFCADPAFFRSR